MKNCNAHTEKVYKYLCYCLTQNAKVMKDLKRLKENKSKQAEIWHHVRLRTGFSLAEGTETTCWASKLCRQCWLEKLALSEVIAVQLGSSVGTLRVWWLRALAAFPGDLSSMWWLTTTCVTLVSWTFKPLWYQVYTWCTHIQAAMLIYIKFLILFMCLCACHTCAGSLKD